MFDHDSKLREVISSEKLESELVLNILINAISKNYNQFDNLDKYLIGKAIQTIEYHKTHNQDFSIEFSKAKP